jgi:hypothetical protein
MTVHCFRNPFEAIFSEFLSRRSLRFVAHLMLMAHKKSRLCSEPLLEFCIFLTWESRSLRNMFLATRKSFARFFRTFLRFSFVSSVLILFCDSKVVIHIDCYLEMSVGFAFLKSG